MKNHNASNYYPLSLRERAGVREIIYFNFDSTPHPNPLPEGEGITTTLRTRT